MPSLAPKPIILVSSTFVDLELHRAALKAALEKAQYDVECMEKYPAFDERPLDKCLSDVARADVYVLLLAHRYGYRPTEGNPGSRSITQLGYEEAGPTRASRGWGSPLAPTIAPVARLWLGLWSQRSVARESDRCQGIQG